MTQHVDTGAVGRLAILADTVRARLYGYVCDSDAPLTRDQVAEAAGITRSLAAYHLDKLVGAGLLSATYRRPPDRRLGPGAGRPAKVYARIEGELTVSVPMRDYELLARLLVKSVERDHGGAVRAAVNAAALAAGQDIGRSARQLAPAEQPRVVLLDALASCGYQPHECSPGGIELRNCPFHRLVNDHRELVCGLNLRLIEGIIAGVGAADARAVPDARPNRCCVNITGAAG